MLEFVMNLPTFFGAAVLMFLTAAAGLLTYWLSKKYVFSTRTAETKDAASSAFRVIGILLSLFLSLTFADVLIEVMAIPHLLYHSE